jgi:hypothetical protein
VIEQFILWGVIILITIYLSGVLFWRWDIIHVVKTKYATRNLDRKYQVLISEEKQRKKLWGTSGVKISLSKTLPPTT